MLTGGVRSVDRRRSRCVGEHAGERRSTSERAGCRCRTATPDAASFARDDARIVRRGSGRSRASPRGDVALRGSRRPRFDSRAAAMLRALRRRGRMARSLSRARTGDVPCARSWSIVLDRLAQRRGDRRGRSLRDRAALLRASTDARRLVREPRRRSAPADRRRSTRRRSSTTLYIHMIPAPRTIFTRRRAARRRARVRRRHRGDRRDARRHWQPRFDEPVACRFGSHSDEFLRAAARRSGDATLRRRIGRLLPERRHRQLDGRRHGRARSPASRRRRIRSASMPPGTTRWSTRASRRGTSTPTITSTTSRPTISSSAIPAVAAVYDQPFGNSSARAGVLLRARSRASDGVDANARRRRRRRAVRRQLALRERNACSTAYRDRAGAAREARVIEPLFVPRPARWRRCRCCSKGARLRATCADADARAAAGLQPADAPRPGKRVHAGIPAQRRPRRAASRMQRATLRGSGRAIADQPDARVRLEIHARRQRPAESARRRRDGRRHVGFPLLDDALADFSLALARR